MKAFLVVLAVAFVFANGESESSEEFDIKELKEVNEMLTEKFNISIIGDIINMVEKVKEKCPDVESKLESTAAEVESCLEDIELGSETICSLVRKNYDRCTKPVREVVISCLPDKSKDLPVLGEKIILALIDQACNSTVEEILELMNPCSFEKDITETESCKEIVEVVQKYKNELPSKELICDMLPKIKKCNKDHQEATCKNPVTIRSHVAFIEAIEDALKGECETLNKT